MASWRSTASAPISCRDADRRASGRVGRWPGQAFHNLSTPRISVPIQTALFAVWVGKHNRSPSRQPDPSGHLRASRPTRRVAHPFLSRSAHCRGCPILRFSLAKGRRPRISTAGFGITNLYRELIASVEGGPVRFDFYRSPTPGRVMPVTDRLCHEGKFYTCLDRGSCQPTLRQKRGEGWATLGGG